jgi:hypothetical protein
LSLVYPLAETVLVPPGGVGTRIEALVERHGPRELLLGKVQEVLPSTLPQMENVGAQKGSTVLGSSPHHLLQVTQRVGDPWDNRGQQDPGVDSRAPQALQGT